MLSHLTALSGPHETLTGVNVYEKRVIADYYSIGIKLFCQFLTTAELQFCAGDSFGQICYIIQILLAQLPPDFLALLRLSFYLLYVS